MGLGDVMQQTNTAFQEAWQWMFQIMAGHFSTATVALAVMIAKAT